MSKIRQSSVNFGSGSGGLSTVGYTLYNFDGSVKTARATTNVNEIGTDTGIYAATFTADDDWDGIILWDTGEASPIYAQDEKYSSTSMIQDETAKIRVIWNTLKNKADYEAKMLQEIAGIKESYDKHPEALELTLKHNYDKLNECVLKSISEKLSELQSESTSPFDTLELNKSIDELQKSIKTIEFKVANLNKDIPMQYVGAIREIQKTNKLYSDKIDKSQYEALRRLEGVNMQYNKLLSNLKEGDVDKFIKALEIMVISIKEIESMKELLANLLENITYVSQDISNSANQNILAKLADPSAIPMLMGLK